MSSADATLGRDVNAVARLEGEFLLRSGQTSNVYFDKYRFEARPDLLRRVAAVMAALLPKETEILAGLELGGVPIATAMSLETGIQAAFVRKVAKDYGTCLAIEGADVNGKKVVIVEDVITTGGQVALSAADLKAAGAELVAVVCAIYRGEGEPHVKGLKGVPVLAALTRDQLV
jgi:orotate phosphoribosyltransferase